jgi:hypothetical protein
MQLSSQILPVDGVLEIHICKGSLAPYKVELRFDDLASDGENDPVSGPCRIVPEEFEEPQSQVEAQAYGVKLSDGLFRSDDDEKVLTCFQNVMLVLKTRGGRVRVKLVIEQDAPELQALIWELLTDPDDPKIRISTNVKTPFSRFLFGRGWTTLPRLSKSDMKALIAIPAPTNWDFWGLTKVEAAKEVALAKSLLKDVQPHAMEGPVTLDALVNEIRDGGYHLLYLVCHGAMVPPDSSESPEDFENGVAPDEASTLQQSIRLPYLWLEDNKRELKTESGGLLASRLKELGVDLPRLMILVSCESANARGWTGQSAHASLAPRLVNAGVPALIAMQGKIKVETAHKFIEPFLNQMMQHGGIDQAMAVARGEIREMQDSWMPALFLQLKQGKLWYVPGFSPGANDDVPWDSVCGSVVNGDLVPIIGPDLAEHIFGSSRLIAAQLAERNEIRLSPNEKPDPAKIAQRILTKSGSQTLRNDMRRILQEKLLEKGKVLLKIPESDNASPLVNLGPLELMGRIVDELIKDPNEPFRILSELNVKVYVCGASDSLLKLFLKKSDKPKRPLELFSDWRTECIVDQSRLLQAADTLCEDLRNAAGVSVADVVCTWRDGLLREGESTLPVSLASAADLLSEMLQDEPTEPATTVAAAWRDVIRKPPTDTPSKPLPPETPLVYYHFGVIRYENTWVLTEDDFFDHLIRTTSNTLMPKIVADKLVAGSLLFLGFSLDDWKFRILFRLILSKDGKGLLKNRRYYHVGVQIDPDEYAPEEEAEIKKFLKSYLGVEANINIFWGTPADFLKSLRDRLRNPKYRKQASKPGEKASGW